jgi:hypothetical protein
LSSATPPATSSHPRLRLAEAIAHGSGRYWPEINNHCVATRVTGNRTVATTTKTSRRTRHNVAIAADAPRVEHGTERCRILPDDQTQ